MGLVNGERGIERVAAAMNQYGIGQRCVQQPGPLEIQRVFVRDTRAAGSQALDEAQVVRGTRGKLLRPGVTRFNTLPGAATLVPERQLAAGSHVRMGGQDLLDQCRT